MPQWTQYFQPLGNLSRQNVKSVWIFFTGIALLFFRHSLALYLSGGDEGVYWGNIYTIDMCVMALMAHAFFTGILIIDFLTETFAWFCWSDLADRIVFHNTNFTKEDLLYIFIAAITLGYKIYKWNKPKKS